MTSEGANTAVTAPPAGTGFAPGLGETFSINFSTGQGTYSFKLALPDGVAGHSPRLSLEYAHGAGHGAFGLGWRIPLRSIALRLDFGVPDALATPRYLDGGTEIAPLADGSFAALADSAFTRISGLGAGWKIEERTGIVHELGVSTAGRLADPARPDRPHEWLLERTLDSSGNAIVYTWRLDQGIAYLSEVRYATYALRFTYSARPDVRSDGRTGYLRRRALRCSEMALFLDPGAAERKIRSWLLGYSEADGSGVSLLASIQMIFHGAAGVADVRRAPMKFGYSGFSQPGRPLAYRASFVEPASGSAGPPPLDDPDTALVTLDDAPLPGVLKNTQGKLTYWPSAGEGRWAAPRPVSKSPTASSFDRAGLAFVDMDGSGTADLLLAAGTAAPGYYENRGREGFGRFVPFPRGARVSPPWTAGVVRLSDADGDGRIDALAEVGNSIGVWLNRGTEGWSAPTLAPRSATATIPDADLGDPLVFLADINGDGLDDLVRVRSGRVEVWPGLGRGRFAPPVSMNASPRLADLHRRPQDVVLVDIDGDGCADLLRFTVEGLEVYRNRNGLGFAPRSLLTGVPPAIPGTVRAVNLRGRSGAGLVWNSYRNGRVAYASIEFGEASPPYLLSHIENGAGLVSAISYRSAVEDYRRDFVAGSRWTTHFPFPYLVVAGTTETDQVSGQVIEVSYRYHEAHFEVGRRQFEGFRRTDRIEKGDESRPDTLTVFHFLMGEERLPGNGPERAALNGLLARTEIFAVDGSAGAAKPFRIEETEYDLAALPAAADGRARHFLFAAVHRVEDRDRTDDRRVEEKRYEYDALGNVVRERQRAFGTRGGVAQPERMRVTETTYAHAGSRYLVDRPARIMVRDAQGNLATEVRRYYDGADFSGLALGQATRGLLAREEQLALAKTAFDIHYAGMNAAALGYTLGTDAGGRQAQFATPYRKAYDARGICVADRDAAGHETGYEYDAAGLFRTAVTTVLGTTRYTADRAIGAPTLVTAPDGKQSRYAYDAQGRVLATALPGEDLADPPSRYAYDDSRIPNARIGRFRSSASPADEALAATYFDGRGKEFQQRVQVAAGKFVVSGLRQFNAWGDVKEEFEPTFAAASAFAKPATTGKPSRRIVYDALGRTVRVTNYNGGVSTAQYRPFEVVTRDANDNDASAANVARGHFNTPHREEFDVLRQLTRVTDTLAAGVERTYAYRTGLLGELLEVADAAGVLATYTYDARGCRLSIAHREAGEKRLWYDGRRVVVRTVDANGQDLRAEVDPRGRLKKLSKEGVALEEYVYDDALRNALGRLAEVRYKGGRQVFDYDPAGRLVCHTYHFEGLAQPQTLTYRYDRLGREVTVKHTNGTSFTRELTANGWVRAIPGVLAEIEHDPRGLPVRLQYANGVVTQTAYTAGPGRIATQKTTGANGTVLEDVRYRHDLMECLLEDEDVSPGGRGKRSYAYDPLYQLTRAEATEGGAPRVREYGYSNFMNLARYDEADVTLHYDDAAHPDRLAGLTRAGGARVPITHDANGNLLGLPGKTFTWNAKNELERFVAAGGLTADYAYDHRGIRVAKTVTAPGGTPVRTFFVGELAEVRGGNVAFFVRLGPARVAIVEGGSTKFVHPDAMGGTAFFTDAAGPKIASIAYRPFGNVALSSGNIDRRTYGVHAFDAESGLVYMRKRYYAPQIGRFLTPDPLATYQPTELVHRPGALHVYAYVANDPLNRTDHTGLSFWSVVGAIVGVIAAVALAALVVATGGILGVVIGVALAIGIVAVSYVVASATEGTAFGEFMRGFMIGFNAGLNAILASMIFGPVVGIGLGVINFLAAFDTIAGNSVYQGILGWSSWLMPMSWLATGVGLVFFVLNVIPAILTGNQVDAVKINSLSLDWRTGSIVMEGGWMFLPGFQGGYNLGGFSYITPGSGVREHETGHTLSNAAFGSIFHFIGAIDENAIQTTPANAYSEQIADSHDPNGPADRAAAGQDLTIPMWA